MRASSNGHSEVVKLLLAHKYMDVNLQDEVRKACEICLLNF